MVKSNLGVPTKKRRDIPNWHFPSYLAFLQFFVFSIFLITASPALAEEHSISLKCLYLSVTAPLNTDEQSHHIRIDYIDGEVTQVTGPSPTCLMNGTQFEVSPDQIIWRCVEELPGRESHWVGYINRFTNRYDIRATAMIDGGESREFMMRGQCEIVEQKF